MKRARKAMRGLLVEYAVMETVEDSYQEGEIGQTMIVWEGHGFGPFADGKSLREYFADNPPYVPDEPNNWIIFPDDPGPARIEATWTVNNDNETATPREIEEWKAGRVRLWTARLWLDISLVDKHEASEEILRQWTGFSVY